MFIFTRPFAAVAAGLGTAFLVVIGDALCQGSPTPVPGSPRSTVPVTVHIAVTCNAPEACGIVRAGS